MESYGILVGGIVVVLLIQMYWIPSVRNNPLQMQIALSVAAGALAVAVYNPVSQSLQDRLALENGNTVAYIGHGVIFAAAAFGVMLLGDLLEGQLKFTL